MPIDVKPDDLAFVLNILKRELPERAVWAFGSRVGGTAKPFSDLDLAIIGEEPLSCDTRANLAEAFDESDLPFKVDLVDWATTAPAFRRIIEKNRIVLIDAISAS